MLSHTTWVPDSIAIVLCAPRGAFVCQQNTKVCQSSPGSQVTSPLTRPKHLGKSPLYSWPASKHLASFHSLLSLQEKEKHLVHTYKNRCEDSGEKRREQL